MILSFFVTADWEGVTAAGRAWVGLGAVARHPGRLCAVA